ncbi:MAG: hypothetical protein LQ339_006042 [Xanthoria mediterranea]|nr:MAG: hypothetical protein LQ339_006042 [Xanthoria mediterranea]
MVRAHPDASVRYVTLDVFTQERFKGNPLAIVEMPLGGELSPETKQRIAREFNFSETVFLHPRSSELSRRTIDIFTTTQELPFAGHPTIGTLVYLCTGADSAKENETQSFTLQTKAGLIKANVSGDIAEASIPHNVRVHKIHVPWQSILNAQPSLRSAEAGFSTPCPLVSIVKGMTFVLVELPHVEDLAALTLGGPRVDSVEWDQGWESFTAPYFYAIVSEDEEARHVAVRVRMIESTVGEDPATGSAASALSTYLALQRGTARSTYSFSIEQGVEMERHSEIGVKVTLNDSGDGVQDVVLAGSAVLVSEGRLYV